MTHEIAGKLDGPPEVLARLEAAGITTVGDVLSHSECIRRLPARGNFRLHVGDETFHVKANYGKKARLPVPKEAVALAWCQQHDVPTADLVFRGQTTACAITATRDLAPAAPLDDVLRAGTLDAPGRARILRQLARLTARMHDGGHHHRDLYLNHLFVDPADPEGTVRVIDVERLRRHRRQLGRRVIKDLASLEHSASPLVAVDERTRFLVRYLQLRGLPRRGVLPGLIRRIQSKARRIGAHTPRTPVGAAALPGARVSGA
jgi:hypothetical protein